MRDYLTATALRIRATHTIGAHTGKPVLFINVEAGDRAPGTLVRGIPKVRAGKTVMAAAAHRTASPVIRVHAGHMDCAGPAFTFDGSDKEAMPRG